MEGTLLPEKVCIKKYKKSDHVLHMKPSLILSSGVNWDAFSEEHRRTYITHIESPVAFSAVLNTKTVTVTGDVDRGENYKDSTPTMNLLDTAALTVFEAGGTLY